MNVSPWENAVGMTRAEIGYSRSGGGRERRWGSAWIAGPWGTCSDAQ